MPKSKLIFKDNNWNNDTIDKLWDVISKIGTEKYGLTYYTPRFELIDYEGMLNAYSTVALPSLYSHWSFGKQYVQEYNKYKNTHSLAFEVVINSDPSICYLMDSNTATLQALVIAHAAVGHSSFFKNNKLFRDHTKASAIIPFLARSAHRMKEIEQEYGQEYVEHVLDQCHVLRYVSFDKHKELYIPAAERKAAQKDIALAKEAGQDKILDFSLSHPLRSDHDESIETKLWNEGHAFDDNVLKFIRTHAINMPEFVQEIIDIFLVVNQYLFPQIQTKLMNEGWASFWHYTIMKDLYNEGYIDESSYWEFLQVHAAVLYQPGVEDKNYDINPYKLGFDMFQDIKRISMEPTEEDKEWFPDWAGNGEWLANIKYAMESYKDESFIQQYLSPKLIRDYKFVTFTQNYEEGVITVTAHHSEPNYVNIVNSISEKYNFFHNVPSVMCEVLGHQREQLRIGTLGPLRNCTMSEESSRALERAATFLWSGPVKFLDFDPEDM